MGLRLLNACLVDIRDLVTWNCAAMQNTVQYTVQYYITLDSAISFSFLLTYHHVQYCTEFHWTTHDSE